MDGDILLFHLANIEWWLVVTQCPNSPSQRTKLPITLRSVAKLSADMDNHVFSRSNATSSQKLRGCGG